MGKAVFFRKIYDYRHIYDYNNYTIRTYWRKFQKLTKHPTTATWSFVGAKLTKTKHQGRDIFLTNTLSPKMLKYWFFTLIELFPTKLLAGFPLRKCQSTAFNRASNTKNADFVLSIGLLIGRKSQKLLLLSTLIDFETQFSVKLTAWFLPLSYSTVLNLKKGTKHKNLGFGSLHVDFRRPDQNRQKTPLVFTFFDFRTQFCPILPVWFLLSMPYSTISILLKGVQH